MDTDKLKVARGVKLLNKKGPEGWCHYVVLGRLDVALGTECVLGQVYGSSLAGKYFLRLSENDAVRCGFQAPDLQESALLRGGWRKAEQVQYAALTAAWREAILKLRAQQR